jgi:hypothetical protein
MKSERQKMLDGEPYDPMDPELVAARERAREGVRGGDLERPHRTCEADGLLPSSRRECAPGCGQAGSQHGSQARSHCCKSVTWGHDRPLETSTLLDQCLSPCSPWPMAFGLDVATSTQPASGW